MAVLTPCLHCPRAREGCEIKARVLAGIRGLRLSSARIRCDIYRGLFREGQRVHALVPGFYAATDHDEPSAETWPGTVFGPSKNRRDAWVIVLDDGWNEAGGDIRSANGFVALRPANITTLNEPDRPERIQEIRAREAEELRGLL